MPTISNGSPLPQTKQRFVLHTLRARIASGELKPGDWIRTDEWAKRLNVSQTPVREALRQMEAQGIVEIHPHVGAQVKVYSVTELEDYFRLRGMLEGLAAELAVSRCPKDQLEAFAAEIEEFNGELKVLAKAGDVIRFQEINHLLHRRILEYTDSPLMLQLVEGLRAMGHPFDSLFYLRTDPASFAEIVQDHQDIADAIRSGSPESALEAARKHTDTAGRRVTRIAGELEPSPFSA